MCGGGGGGGGLSGGLRPDDAVAMVMTREAGCVGERVVGEHRVVA